MATASANIVHRAPEAISSPAEDLFKAVREILRKELGTVSLTESEIEGLLGVTKSQANQWLTRLAKDGIVEKVKKTKPAQYRLSTVSDRLL